MKTTNNLSNNNNYLGPWSDDNLLSPNLLKQTLTKLSISPGPEMKVVSRVPSIIKLVRDVNGHYTLSGLESMNLCTSNRLREILESILTEIRLINSLNDAGFVNSTRISDLPVLSGYLQPYINSKALLELDEKGRNSKTEKEILEIIDSELTLREKRVIIKWFYSLFNLNLYSLIIDVLHRLPLTGIESEEEKDLIADLTTCARYLHGNISASIRESLRQRGITISENVYCGYDTEYKSIEMKENKILSAQWAVNSKITLTLPHICEYDFSGMNTHSGEIYPVNSMWFSQEKLRFTKLQDKIRELIGSVRKIKCGSNDVSLKALTNGLIKEGLPYFVENGKINFSLSRTPIKTYFKGSEPEKLDLKKLVQIGINLESKDMDSNREGLYSLLKSINISKENVENLDEIPGSNISTLISPDGSSVEIIDPAVEVKKPLIKANKNKKERKDPGSSSRNTTTEFTDEKMSVTTRRNFHIIGHLTQADMCFLADFEEIKKSFNIVNKCMVTLGKSDITLYGHSIQFRDTLLLAPGGKKSLAAIGGMYGKHLEKIVLTKDQHANMDNLKDSDPVLFKEYALRDSLISLVHASILEDAHFKQNRLGIPLTLASMGGSNLKHTWKQLGYKGYQINKDYLLGDSRKVPTPKGMFTLGKVGLAINDYIANYKGGRNESFMIGKDEKSNWYDYDLTAAYTTAMSMMGDPHYNLIRSVSSKEIQSLTDEELLYSYIMIRVKFQFDESVTYPSIPCFADEITTVYPRSGEAELTGSEYLTARNQGCNLEIEGGTLIPFRYKAKTDSEWVKIYNDLKYDNVSIIRALPRRDSEEYRWLTRTEKYRVCILDYLGVDWSNQSDIELEEKLNRIREESQEVKVEGKTKWERYKSLAFPSSKVFDLIPLDLIFSEMPFLSVISELQSERRKHAKGTINNLLYKEMGNSLYGSVTRGINHKVKYDIKTNKTVRMESSEFSNPILAGWITGTVRSLIGELMDGVDKAGGKIVSVTTDGFITDKAELEAFLLSKSPKFSLLTEYRKIREILSGDPSSLELKHEGQNIMSWTTRGQLSMDMKLKAITGLQTRDLDQSETWDLISSGNQALGKTITFTSTNLRSATDIYKKGGHVTMEYRDQDFRLWYNNNRKIITEVLDKETGLLKPVDRSGLLTTEPWNSIEEALTARSFSNLTKGGIYQRNTSLKSLNKYKSYLELGVRSFVKDVLNNRNGVNYSMFGCYKGLIDFINKYMYESGIKLKIRLDSSYISQIKYRSIEKVQKPFAVPRRPEITKFFDYVKEAFTNYDTSLILEKINK